MNKIFGKTPEEIILANREKFKNNPFMLRMFEKKMCKSIDELIKEKTNGKL